MCAMGPVMPYDKGYIQCAGNKVWGAPCEAPVVQIVNRMSVGISIGRVNFDPALAPIETISTFALGPGQTAMFTHLVPSESPVLAMRTVSSGSLLSMYKFSWDKDRGYTLTPYPTKFDISDFRFLDHTYPADPLRLDAVNLLDLESYANRPRYFPSPLIVTLVTGTTPSAVPVTNAP